MTRPSGNPRSSTAVILAKLAGVLVVVSVLAAGLLLPYVGGLGLAAKTESDKFLNSACDLKETAPPQGTKFYASDGTTLLATIFTQNRNPVDLAQIPTFLQKALVDTEDRRFYAHHGVDMRGLLRSAFSTGGGDTQGGSTLTMQYVKQERYYQAGNDKAAQDAAISQNLNRKIQDAKCAINLEQRETKQQILQNYFNIAFFGENSYSVQSAAVTYFNKNVSQLTVPEAALLVGVLRAPSDYDPFQHPQAARDRRNEVIDSMVSAGDLTRAQADQYEATPVKLYTNQPPPTSQGCYNASSTVANAGFFCDYVQTWLKNTQGLGSDAISEGGYKVVTTLNASIQNSAQTALSAAYPLTGGNNTTALMPVVDNKTGNVLAMVSSKPFGVKAGQLASSNVFTGYVANGASTYKYFTMLAALEAGMTQDYRLSNNSKDTKSYKTSSCSSGSYTAMNGDPNIPYTQTETLKSAIAKSSNTFFVALEDQFFHGCDLAPILSTATSLGMDGLNQVDNCDGCDGKQTYAQVITQQQQATLTLGYVPTSPLELTGAYAAAANDGAFCKPAPVLSITDQAGHPVAVKRAPCTVQMTPQVARTAVSLLSGDTKPGGTSAKQFSGWYSNNPAPIAGKTGTDSAYDAATKQNDLNSSFWFVGMTHDMTATMTLANITNPTAPASDIPGYSDDQASKRLDGAIAAQFWLTAMQPTLSPQHWSFASSTAIPGSQTVPDMTGESQAAAQTALTARGFKVEIFPSECSSSQFQGQVAYYSPQTAVPGTTVTLCLSQYGAPYVVTPPLGRTRSATPGGPVGGGAPPTRPGR